MKVKVLSALFISFLALYFVSCNSPQKQSNDMQSTVADSVSNILYAFPSPDEIFEYIELNNIDFKTGLVNAPGNYSKYNLTNQQLMNLGVYISDISYLAAFARTSEIPAYLNAIKNLAVSTNLTGIYPEKEIESALGKGYQPDSLISFAQTTFSNAIEFLIENDLNQQMAYISLGAFTESLYLAVNYVDKDFDEEIAGKIIEQKFAFDNIAQMLKSGISETDQRGIEILEGLQQAFSLAKFKTIDQPATDNKTFTPAQELTVTPEDFVKFKKNIQAIRQQIVN